MVDQVADAFDYMNGKRLDDPGIYFYACSTIARYYKGLGYSKDKVVDEILKWRDKYGLMFAFYVTDCVSVAFKEPKPLRNKVRVSVSKDDIRRIRDRTSTKEQRLSALAILCYAKVADRGDGVFVLPINVLANWIGMHRENVQSRAIKKLIEFGYIRKVAEDGTVNGWFRKEIRHANNYEIRVPYDSDGEYELIDNNIRALYEKAFLEPVTGRGRRA